MSSLAVRQDLNRLRKADMAAKAETKSSRKRKALLKADADDRQAEEEEGHLTILGLGNGIGIPR